jgi:hypothetical protein
MSGKLPKLPQLPVTTWEWISPAIAAEMLTHNTMNRPIIDSAVAEWVREMESGNWVPTHQGIAFDVSGVLLDGQHRLAAIVRSGRTVLMQVTRGLPPEVMPTIDSGRKRTSGQILAMAGVKDSNLIAGIVKVVLCYRETVLTGGDVQNFTALLGRSRTAREIQDAAGKMEGIEIISTPARRMSRAAALQSPAAVGAALYQCFLANALTTEQFVEGIVEGSELRSGDARLTMRNRALSGNLGQKRGGSATQAYSFGLVMGAWRAFHSGKSWHKAQVPTNLLQIGPINV